MLYIYVVKYVVMCLNPYLYLVLSLLNDKTNVYTRLPMEVLSQVWITRPWHIWVRHDLKITNMNNNAFFKLKFVTTDLIN
jgi:ABC-type glycerol-3-phosphate transport system permease component